MKDVNKIREEIAVLEEQKELNSMLTEQDARELTPYICKEVPTLFKIIFTECEKDYKEIADNMLSHLERMNAGLSLDKTTESLGRYLFEKLVEPNLPETKKE